MPCTGPALMGQPLMCRAPDSQDRSPCRSPRHAAPSTVGVAVIGRPGVAPPLWRRLVFIPRTSARRQSCGVRCPWPLAVAHPSDLWPMPQGECRSRTIQRRCACGGVPAPINPLRGGPGWIGEPTKKPARREPCGLVICRGVFPHRFHVLPDSPPGDVYQGERWRFCLRLRSRYAVYLSLCRPQPSSAPSCA